MLLVGSTSMPMFSKKGRLKTGQQRLQVRAMRCQICSGQANNVTSCP